MKKAFVFFLLIVTILLLVGYTVFIKDVGAPIYAGDFQCRIYLDKTVKISYYGGCDEEVTIPSYIDGYKVVGIGTYAFQDSSVKKVTLPKTVETIDLGAFDNCKLLEEIEFSYGLKTVAEAAFEDCVALRELEFPDSLERVGGGAFWGCTSLERIDFGSGIVDIESLVQPIMDAITSIEGYSSYNRNRFGYCENLKEIEFGSDSDYYYAEDGVIYSKDGKRLVCYCPGKEDIEFTIPDSVEVICQDSFYKCDNLKSIYMKGDVPPTSYNDIVKNYSDIILYVPTGTLKEYQNTSPWKRFNIQEYDY